MFHDKAKHFFPAPEFNTRSSSDLSGVEWKENNLKCVKEIPLYLFIVTPICTPILRFLNAFHDLIPTLWTSSTTSNVQEFGSKIFLMEPVKGTADVHFLSLLEDDNDKLLRNVTAFSTCQGITAFARRWSLVEGYTKLNFTGNNIVFFKLRFVTSISVVPNLLLRPRHRFYTYFR
ncbi:hypothetical protein IW262DRAFT_1299096 [Armillaria fumosa]|nr:hypothetical protein IW262DRAFT_1299096 [Armillaria fumosa]